MDNNKPKEEFFQRLVFSEDSKWLKVFQTSEKGIILNTWDVEKGTHSDKKFSLRGGITATSSISANGENFVSQKSHSSHKVVVLRNQTITQSDKNYNESIFCFEFSPDNKTIASIDLSGIFKLISTETADTILTHPFYFLGDKTYKPDRPVIRFNSTGEFIATNGGWEGSIPFIRLKDWETIKELKVPSIPKGDFLTHDICFSRDNKYIAAIVDSATIVADNRIIVWKVDDGSFIKEVQLGDNGASVITSPKICFSPSGKYLVTTSDNGIRFWNTNNFELATYIPNSEVIVDFAFSPDEKYFAFCGRRSVVNFFKISND